MERQPDQIIDPNLGIKARRSKNARGSNNRGEKLRNPISEHTLDDDLPYIREYAKKFNELDERTRQALQRYVFEGKSLDYYYGSYVAAYQLFVMAYMANNEITPSLMALLHAISHKIIETIDRAAEKISSAQDTPKKEII